MQGSAKRNLLTFKELCGEKALGKVILATTMWDKVTEEEGARREQELQDRSEFWGWMLSKGSSYYRLEDTTDSKRRIVHLLADHDEPVATNIQKQLVDERRRLDETSAGREVQSELIRERGEWEKEREEIRRQVEKAIKQKDLEAQEALEEERERFTGMIEKVEENTNMLRSTLEELIVRRDKKLEDTEKVMKERETSYEKELERLKSDKMHIEQEKAMLEPNASELPTPIPSKGLGPPPQDKKRSVRPKDRRPHSPFSVSRYGDRCILTSWDSRYQSLPSLLTTLLGKDAWPPETLDSSRRESVSLGKAGAWIASYHGGIWRTSPRFTEDHYPALGGKLYYRGLNNLDACFLGPQERYFARWQDGTIEFQLGSEEIEVQAQKLFLKLSRQIVAVAFGYEGTYLFSYGNNLTRLKHLKDLKGHYPKLQELISKNNGLSIVSITLDPKNKNDYIIVYTQHEGDGICHIDWACKVSSRISGAISDWWDLTSKSPEVDERSILAK
ncbi:hypothetical protein F5B21DRAFT_500021 [Xylaria acuta]|nr:hypothetical protein F5B21DRAFT_500021 [Xylaria acuta]